MKTIVDKAKKLLKKKNQIVIGISGITFSGKSEVASELKQEMEEAGLTCKIIEVKETDGILEKAFAEKNPAKFFYENFIEESDISKSISDSDEPVLIVDGILLFKNNSPVKTDLRIWVDCTFTTSLKRAEAAGKDLKIHRELYEAVQKIHFPIDSPFEKANLIVMNDELLDEDENFMVYTDFKDGIPENMKWLNEPNRMENKGKGLKIMPDSPTDFWQRTLYGFRNDNGHFLYMETEKDFEMTVKLEFNPKFQYDQCGLAVRIDENNWIKTSVEHETDKSPTLGAVVTNLGYSDWSVQELEKPENKIRLRITRKGSDYVIEAKLNKKNEWKLLRICHLHHNTEKVLCGFYCCSPISEGFTVLVKELKIREVIS